MPGPMPMPTASMPNLAANPQGGGFASAQSGYNSAMQNLQKSLQASQNTTNFQQQQLGQQLQNNQGQVAQNLANRGLGNTTVSQTMAQAPLQSYNMGMAQLGDQSAMRQMGAYNNLAQMSAQGGMGLAQLQQPYAQTNFTQQKVAGMQPGPQSDFNQGQGQQNQMMQLQNMLAMQQPLYFGAGQAGSQQVGGVSSAQAQQAAMLGLTGDASADFGG